MVLWSPERLFFDDYGLQRQNIADPLKRHYFQGIGIVQYQVQV